MAPGLQCKAGGLSQKFNGEGVSVAFPIAGLNGSDDHKNYPQYKDDGEEDKPDAKITKSRGEHRINRVADLKVKHLFADIIEISTLRAFEEPYDEWGKNLPERRKWKPCKAA